MEIPFKIVPFRGPDYVEEKEKPDEFGKLLANLKEEVDKLENDEAKSKIIKYLKLEALGKVNDEELKSSLFITKEIIDKIKNLIEKYEVQNDDDLDEKTKEASLEIVEKIKEHCEKYNRQV